MNQQPIEKQTKLGTRPIKPLDVHSVFYTIQGEGPFAGSPAVFVRLAGCNLQCPLCDTDYTSKREFLTTVDLRDRVIAASDGLPANHTQAIRTREAMRKPSPLVVITGGEPFRQDITYHVWALLDAGFPVQIETNGTLFIPDFPYERVTIVCSPKAGKVNKHLAPYITAYKYVIRAGEVAPDGLPTLALAHPASPRVARPPHGFMGTVYVQPCDEGNNVRNSKNLTAAVDSAMKHGYTLGIQLHKLIGVD